MAERFNMFYLMVLLVMGVLFHDITATTHTVGGSLGWTIPSDSNAYATWASQQTFVVGDVLVFNFANGAHNVIEVTKAGFDTGSDAAPISTTTTSPASITLSGPGEHYFICSFRGHYAAGMKLSITVFPRLV